MPVSKDNVTYAAVSYKEQRAGTYQGLPELARACQGVAGHAGVCQGLVDRVGRCGAEPTFACEEETIRV